MRLYSLITLLFATTVLSEPTLSDKRTNQLTSPFLHRRSDMVITRDGRLISRQDCCEDPPGCGCASATCCPDFPGCAC
ncbi:hypothetical protein PILCRDRAFT_822280 [Piloderma croceum F 1598]|uniref:Conotoxin n=1 Tax=Piloderma croceum (strain F 1598) TaxID=765440 RepID=A0A0C3B2W1_PILCF|nr:hypothetical protein PILCRDRAFT_822280 [Piloderma croceum F 1598]